MLADPSGHPFCVCASAESAGVVWQEVSIDCPDGIALGRFYAELLGYEMTYSGPEGAFITADGEPPIMFQNVADYNPPRWPDPATRSRGTDIRVDDIDARRPECSRSARPGFPVVGAHEWFPGLRRPGRSPVLSGLGRIALVLGENLPNTIHVHVTGEFMACSRRGLLHGALLTLGGAGVGAAATAATEMMHPGRLPLDGGYAPAGNPSGWSQRGGLRTFWHVPAGKPWVALTFDDGPEPSWTPRVLDTLERLEAPATFFVVGDRLQRNARLVRGRYERHEVAEPHVDTSRPGAARRSAGARRAGPLP